MGYAGVVRERIAPGLVAAKNKKKKARAPDEDRTRDLGIMRPTRCQLRHRSVSSQRIGAAEARWAHNPKVPGSKPGFATKNKFFYVFCVLVKFQMLGRVF